MVDADDKNIENEWSPEAECRWVAAAAVAGVIAHPSTQASRSVENETDFTAPLMIKDTSYFKFHILSV